MRKKREGCLNLGEDGKFIEVAVESLHLEGHPSGLRKVGEARVGLLGGKSGTLSIPRATLFVFLEGRRAQEYFKLNHALTTTFLC